MLDAIDDIEKIWRLKCKIVECQISLGKLEEVQRAVLLLYEDLTNKNFDESFAEKTKRLAKYLENSNADEEFFALNFFAIYVSLDKEADKKLIFLPTLNSSENEKFFNILKMTLEKDFAADQIDFVNDIYEEIKSSSKLFPAAEKYLTLVESFIFKYKFNDIDFKNRN